ncbi:MAG: ligand-binding sensor domain-containing protein, partial [Bacteroidales bacterium]
MTKTIKFLNQIKNYTFLLFSVLSVSLNGQIKTEFINNTVTGQTSDPRKGYSINVLNAIAATQIDRNIRSIFQDKQGNYWFGTNGDGVYCYNGKTLNHFTVKDGLSNNQVQSIQEDNYGNIWFGTGMFGVSKFDGKVFTSYTKKENKQIANDSYLDWKLESDDLWFYAGGGAFRYNGNSFGYLPLANPDLNPKPTDNSPYNLSSYAVYSLLKDKKGNVWFGTQAQGVCCYDGKTFTWFTEKGLGGPAVLALFEDNKGNLWFGNNGSGLFRYDGKSLINFTEEKGLGNNEFRVSGKSVPGTLARIYTINDDKNGNLWIGTVDSGVWRYDGDKLTNYTTKDGLTSNAINVIYKDRNDELWFGT